MAALLCNFDFIALLLSSRLLSRLFFSIDQVLLGQSGTTSIARSSYNWSLRNTSSSSSNSGEFFHSSIILLLNLLTSPNLDKFDTVFVFLISIDDLPSLPSSHLHDLAPNVVPVAFLFSISNPINVALQWWFVKEKKNWLKRKFVTKIVIALVEWAERLRGRKRWCLWLSSLSPFWTGEECA